MNPLKFSLCFLTSWGAAALLNAGLEAAEAARPNIVYILADDMGRGDISAYNRDAAWRTPNIDGMAADGLLFTDAHSSSAVCTPSRYSTLTGRYNWRSSRKSGVTGGFSPALLEPGRLTVPGFLRQKGYATAMVGKWHLGLNWVEKGRSHESVLDDPTDGEVVGIRQKPVTVDYSQPFSGGPTDHGFDSFIGISASLDMPPYVWLRDNRVEARLPLGRIKGRDGYEMWRAGPIGDDFTHDSVLPREVSEAVRFLEKQDGKKPFFLYLALTAPHTPILPTGRFAGFTRTTPYGDFCVQVDDVVGKVLAALAARGLAENTLVVFTADNGCSPGANFSELAKFHHDPGAGFRGAKADIYEGGHRIPFVARWPAKIPRGRVSDELICQTDLFATCAAILTENMPENAAEDSVSFLPVLLGGSPSMPLREALVHHSINGSFAIRQGAWKLCLTPDSGGWSAPLPGKVPAGSPPFQLFDLSKDPGEKNNLYAAHPEIVQRLGKLARRYVIEGRSTPGAPQQNAGGNDWPELAWMNAFK